MRHPLTLTDPARAYPLSRSIHETVKLLTAGSAEPAK